MRDATRAVGRRRDAVERTLSAAAEGVARVARKLRESARRAPGFLFLLFATTAAWILLWAWYDAILLTDAFPSAPGYSPNLTAYWTSTWWVLFPLTTFLIFRRHAWLPILALVIGGWEDILFYWVQGHPVPSAIAYLPLTPTALALYVRAALFLVVAFPGAAATRLPAARIRFVPLELVMLVSGLLGGIVGFIASIPAYLALRWCLTRWARPHPAAGGPGP